MMIRERRLAATVRLVLALGLFCSVSVAQGLQAIDISFVDEFHGWVLTAEPTPAIFRTSDGGQTWLQIPISFGGGFYRLDFFDRNTGIAVGFESNGVTAVYRTDDSGESWTKVNTIVPPYDGHIVDLDLTSPNEGFLVGEGSMGRGFVAHFLDRGGSLRLREDLPVDFTTQSNALGAFHDGTGHFWIVGKELILHSADNGKTWEDQFLSSSPRIDMAMSGIALPGGFAWMAVASFEIYRTEDYGKHWVMVLTTSGPGSVNFSSVSFITPDHGCAVGDSPFIYCTLDGGKSWVTRSVFNYQRNSGFSSKLQLFKSNRGWATVSGVLYKTEDGGQSFTRMLTESDFLETGKESPALKSSINGPTELAFSNEGLLYIVESVERRLVRLDIKKGSLKVMLAEPDVKTEGEFAYPTAIAVDPEKKILIADFNGRLRKLDPDTGVVTILYPPSGQKSQLERVDSIVFDQSGALLMADDMRHRIVRWNFATRTLAPVPAGSMRFPMGVAIDEEGDIFIADYENCRIRKVDDQTQVVTTVAGTGECASKGDDGPAVTAALHYPSSIVADRKGNLYFVEGATDRVRRIDARGIISTYAGTGEKGFSGDGGRANEAKLNNPSGLALDPDGNLYISEYVNNRIRRVDAATRTIHTVAGSGNPKRVDILM